MWEFFAGKSVWQEIYVFVVAETICALLAWMVFRLGKVAQKRKPNLYLVAPYLAGIYIEISTAWYVYGYAASLRRGQFPIIHWITLF